MSTSFVDMSVNSLYVCITLTSVFLQVSTN